MQNFMETIIYAIKSWVRYDAVTKEEALDIAMDLLLETNVITPITIQENKIITDSQGRIYSL